MSGFGPTGALPIGGVRLNDSQAAPSKFQQLLDDPSRRRLYLIETFPRDVDAAQDLTLRYSTGGFKSAPSDPTTPNTLWLARVLSALEFERQLANGGLVSGRALPTFGNVQLANGDGRLTALFRYAWAGRQLDVLMGADGFDRQDFGNVFCAAARRVTGDRDTLSIVVSDASPFDQPIQTNTYAGTGGTEGGDEIKDREKPLSLGLCREVPAVLVDPASLLYQVHDGPINAIRDVYDNGLALLFTAGVPVPGEYSVDLVNGRFTLGGSPAGTVTADVEGATFGGTYVDRTAELIRQIAVTYGGLSDPSGINVPAFANLNTAQPAPVGIHVGPETRSLADVLDELARGIGAAWGFNRQGLLTIDRLEAPIGIITASFDETNITELEPVAIDPPFDVPAQRIAVTWRKIYNVPSQDGLAGGVSDARRAFLSLERRLAAAEDPTVGNDHLEPALPDPIDALFDEQTDAEAEATRVQGLFGVPREMFRIRANLPPFQVELNDSIRVAFPAFGLDAGKFFRVVRLLENATAQESELLVWG